LTPDFWGKHKVDDHPFEAFSGMLKTTEATQQREAREEGERPPR